MTEPPEKIVRRPLSGKRSARMTVGGPARNANVSIPADLVRAVDRWIAAQPQPESRSDAVRKLLRDALISQGAINFSEGQKAATASVICVDGNREGDEQVGKGESEA